MLTKRGWLGFEVIGMSAESPYLLVPAAGVEPATFRSGGERSNPLSYAGKVVDKLRLSRMGTSRVGKPKFVTSIPGAKKITQHCAACHEGVVLQIP